MKHIFLFDLANFVITGFTNHKSLILFIVLGLVAGLVAQLIVPGKGLGLVATAVIGIAGCYLGNLLLVEHITFVDHPILKELIAAIVCSGLIQAAIALVMSGQPKRNKAR